MYTFTKVQGVVRARGGRAAPVVTTSNLGDASKLAAAAVAKARLRTPASSSTSAAALCRSSSHGSIASVSDSGSALGNNHKKNKTTAPITEPDASDASPVVSPDTVGSTRLNLNAKFDDAVSARDTILSTYSCETLPWSGDTDDLPRAATFDIAALGTGLEDSNTDDNQWWKHSWKSWRGWFLTTRQHMLLVCLLHFGESFDTTPNYGNHCSTSCLFVMLLSYLMRN
jgi:hypothetical protein